MFPEKKKKDFRVYLDLLYIVVLQNNREDVPGVPLVKKVPMSESNWTQTLPEPQSSFLCSSRTESALNR